MKQLDNNITEKEEELKKINDKIDSNKSILNNQQNLIQNNEKKIRKQNIEINENINLTKNMKYIEKQAIFQLKSDIKSNYNFIKNIEAEARTEVKEEYLNSKSFKNNIEVNILDKKIAEQNEVLERIINRKNIIAKEVEELKNNAIEEATKIKNNALLEANEIKNNSMKKVNEEILKKEKERKEKELELKQLSEKYNNLNKTVQQIQKKVIENIDTYEAEIAEAIKSDLNSERKEDFELFCSFNKNLEKSIRKTENLSKQEAKQIIYDTYIETNETVEKKHFNFSQIFEKLFNYLKLNIEDFKSKNNAPNTHNLSINASKSTKLNDRQ